MEDWKPLPIPLAAGFFVFYSLMQLWLSRSYWSNAVVRHQSEVREVSGMDLPDFFFCPAGRSKRERLRRWVAYGCDFNYRDKTQRCDAGVSTYEGYPDQFAGGDGKCIRFDTSKLKVTTEWTSAWNEVWLHAVFEEEVVPDGVDVGFELEEVELGTRNREWRVGEGKDSAEHFYWPLLRVPIYPVPSPVERPPGIATRTFIGEEKDVGKRHAGHFWFTYNAVQVPSKASRFPPVRLSDGLEASPGTSLHGVVVVITIEDFEIQTFHQDQSPPVLFPALSLIGEVAGVAGLLYLLSSPRRKGHLDSTDLVAREPRYSELATREEMGGCLLPAARDDIEDVEGADGTE